MLVGWNYFAFINDFLRIKYSRWSIEHFKTCMHHPTASCRVEWCRNACGLRPARLKLRRLHNKRQALHEGRAYNWTTIRGGSGARRLGSVCINVAEMPRRSRTWGDDEHRLQRSDKTCPHAQTSARNGLNGKAPTSGAVRPGVPLYPTIRSVGEVANKETEKSMIKSCPKLDTTTFSFFRSRCAMPLV
jgi:hypothetical protein